MQNQDVGRAVPSLQPLGRVLPCLLGDSPQLSSCGCSAPASPREALHPFSSAPVSPGDLTYPFAGDTFRPYQYPCPVMYSIHACFPEVCKARRLPFQHPAAVLVSRQPVSQPETPVCRTLGPGWGQRTGAGAKPGQLPVLLERSLSRSSRLTVHGRFRATVAGLSHLNRDPGPAKPKMFPGWPNTQKVC